MASMSSMNLNDSSGVFSGVRVGAIISSSRCARNRLANTTANGVPIAVPLIWRNMRSPYSM